MQTFDPWVLLPLQPKNDPVQLTRSADRLLQQYTETAERLPQYQVTTVQQYTETAERLPQYQVSIYLDLAEMLSEYQIITVLTILYSKCFSLKTPELFKHFKFLWFWKKDCTPIHDVCIYIKTIKLWNRKTNYPFYEGLGRGVVYKYWSLWQTSVHTLYFWVTMKVNGSVAYYVFNWSVG